MKWILGIACFTILISCEPKNLPTVMVLEENYALLKLSHQSTKKEMTEFSRDCSQSIGVSFDFTGSQFFEDGRLRSLKFQIRGPKGRGGRAAADLMNLQNSYVGFLFDLRGAGGAHIKTGKFD